MSRALEQERVDKETRELAHASELQTTEELLNDRQVLLPDSTQRLRGSLQLLLRIGLLGVRGEQACWPPVVHLSCSLSLVG